MDHTNRHDGPAHLWIATRRALPPSVQPARITSVGARPLQETERLDSEKTVAAKVGHGAYSRNHPYGEPLLQL